MEAALMPANWRDAWARLEADDELLAEIFESTDPRARRLRRWVTHDLLPALDPFGLRGNDPDAGEYEWPGSQAEFDAMVAAAVEAARPVQ
jgi:hypothetical protein